MALQHNNHDERIRTLENYKSADEEYKKATNEKLDELITSTNRMTDEMHKLTDSLKDSIRDTKSIFQEIDALKKEAKLNTDFRQKVEPWFNVIIWASAIVGSLVIAAVWNYFTTLK